METCQLSEREQKALAIATHTELVRKPNNTWLVPSQSGANKYTVNPDPESPSCDCPDFEFRRARCKHVLAVEIVLKREIVTDGNTQTVTETVRIPQVVAYTRGEGGELTLEIIDAIDKVVPY